MNKICKTTIEEDGVILSLEGDTGKTVPDMCDMFKRLLQGHGYSFKLNDEVVIENLSEKE